MNVSGATNKKLAKLNEEIRTCKRCRLYETRRNSLPGEGNPSARLMLIAQAPGESENKEGKMFIGPSGGVLDKLLKKAGVNRREIYMTNLVKCMLPKYRRPKRDEIEICSNYLDEEIELINPEVLIPLGYYATKHIFEKYALSLPSKQEFSKVFGQVFLAGTRKVLPLPHPAAVLYNPAFEKEMIKYYHKMSTLLMDCKWYPVCPMKRFYEEGNLKEEWIKLYCKGDWERCVRYQMEERVESHPDWMLPDGSIDERLHKLLRIQ